MSHHDVLIDCPGLGTIAITVTLQPGLTRHQVEAALQDTIETQLLERLGGYTYVMQPAYVATGQDH